MKHKSHMKHEFSKIPSAEIQRSVFNRSHGHKTTFDAGYLIPIYADEALPGDSFRMKMSLVCRMATPIFPVMDNAKVTVHFWAVPLRLLWTNFERFMGAQDNPDDSTDFLTPVIHHNGTVTASDIYNYMGVPIGTYTANGIDFNAFHFRAYNMIYNQWYRDQNLQDSVEVPLGDGPDLPSKYTLLRRNKRHDYFTSCLPWPQKGPGVELPLGDSAPVKTIAGDSMTGTQTALRLRTAIGGSALGSGFLSAGTGGNLVQMSTVSGSALNAGYPSNLVADLSSATAATINSLRQAFQLQRMFERDARGGTRYTELIQSHFNVVSPDARLQRPEYLGGGIVDININPVAQTSSSDATTPQGNLAGFGTAVGGGIGFNKSFTEHCVILGLVSVNCDLTYQQGLNRMFSRRTRYDYYWPALAHLGEQEVKNKEIYCVDNPTQNEGVFGYQERYGEYRYYPSRISGVFNSNAPSTLDSWHYAQKFTSLPTLSDEFIREDPPIDRVIAVQDEPQFLFDSYFDLNCARPMPVYSVPGMIDHF